MITAIRPVVHIPVFMRISFPAIVMSVVLVMVHRINVMFIAMFVLPPFKVTPVIIAGLMTLSGFTPLEGEAWNYLNYLTF